MSNNIAGSQDTTSHKALDNQVVARNLLHDFAEYAHQYYAGSSVENGEWIYGYKTEVVHMIDGFLRSQLPIENDAEVEL